MVSLNHTIRFSRQGMNQCQEFTSFQIITLKTRHIRVQIRNLHELLITHHIKYRHNKKLSSHTVQKQAIQDYIQFS